MEKRILVYDGRSKTAEKVIFLCRKEGFFISVARDGQQVCEMLASQEIHLLLADVKSDEKNCEKEMEMILELRSRSRVPLIVLSGQSAEMAKIMALEAGADDCVTVSCNPLELVARIKSLIRRYTDMPQVRDKISEVCRVEGLVLDDRKRTITVDGRNVRLTPIEYDILRFLAGQKGKVFTSAQIYEHVWKMQAVSENRTVMVHICHIRKKIEADPKRPKYLKAVWGIGYKVGEN